MSDDESRADGRALPSRIRRADFRPLDMYRAGASQTPPPADPAGNESRPGPRPVDGARSGNNAPDTSTGPYPLQEEAGYGFTGAGNGEQLEFSWGGQGDSPLGAPGQAGAPGGPYPARSRRPSTPPGDAGRHGR